MNLVHALQQFVNEKKKKKKKKKKDHAAKDQVRKQIAMQKDQLDQHAKRSSKWSNSAALRTFDYTKIRANSSKGFTTIRNFSCCWFLPKI